MVGGSHPDGHLEDCSSNSLINSVETGLFKNALTECLFLIASETFIMKYYTKYFVGLNSF